MNLEKPLKKSLKDDAPGCYSENSVYWSSESKQCETCPAKRKCRGDRLVSNLDNNAHRALVEGLPVKAGKVLDTLFKNDQATEIRPALLRGENALKGRSPKFISITLDELLKGGFSKRSLRGALVTRLNCKDETAFSWVSMVIAILSALCAITVTHKFYRINYES